jgi:hypothetical protein
MLRDFISTAQHTQHGVNYEHTLSEQKVTLSLRVSIVCTDNSWALEQ